MSKKHQNERPKAPPNTVEPVAEPATREVPVHRKCPLCAPGVGKPGWWRRINGTLVKRQYKCDKCGHDWTAEVRTHTVIERIEYTDARVVSQGVNLEER